MNDKINLLKGNKTKHFEQERIKKILRLLSVVFLSIVVIVSTVFFLLISGSSVESLRKEEQAAISKIKQSEEKAGKLLFTGNRVKDIADIVGKRTTFDGIITSVTDIVPSGTQIDSLSLDKKNFSMTVRSSSLSSINTLLMGIDEISTNKKMFTKVTLEGLTVDKKSGNFIMSILGNFP